MKKTLLMLLVLIAGTVAKAQEVQTVYDITVTAQDDKSGIWLVIGEDNLVNVEELKLTGTINGYDIMIIRDKMPNLHKIDMENVRIIANPYAYYQDAVNKKYSTKDDDFGDYFFYQLSKLTEVKLPSTITRIGMYAICQTHITSIIIPDNVKTIEYGAFHGPGSINSVVFPISLISIGNSAFYNNNISNLNLSGCHNLTSIGNQSFSNNNLGVIRFPESVISINSNAFSNNNTLTDVYVQTILPRNISSNVFSNVGSTTLHVPPMTYYDYYWATGWSSFGTIMEDVNPDYFYVDGDLTIAEDKADNKTVDADVEVNGGIINEDTDTQAFDELNVANNGTNSGSLIPDDNITANNLCFNITVTANHWHFFSFPFRVQLSNVTAPGAYVFRRYNGSTRASGSSGWESLPGETEYLEPGVGYIFQCNNSGTLKIPVASPNFNWASMTTTNTLTAHAAASDQDASWNFVGNPLTSYYDIDDLSYNAPLTIWNGSNYVAYRPGDDNYQLHPFEAFFVQKPDGNAAPTYGKAGRMTYTQATNHHNNKAAAARSMYPEKRDRHLLNLVLSNGEQKDQTRVVFNEKKTAGYERECDAAKFMSMEQVPQLYTLEQQTQYAINERQQGSVQVGFTAPKAGTYTLKAERMDMPMVLKDNMAGTTFDLKNGEYTFESEAGTFNNRFFLMPAGDPTGIKTATTTENEGSVYGLDGRRVDTNTKGVVIENGKKVVK